MGQAIRAAVAERSSQLPSYQRLSDYAITRAPLPRTELGKIRRHLLAERYEQAKSGAEDQGPAAAGPLAPEEMSPQDRALLEDPAVRQVWDWLARRYPDQRLTPDTSPQLDLGVDSLEWILIWFPEGERSWNGKLQPFKPGIGLLLHHIPVPVGPVFIHGTHAALPRGKAVLRPGQITVVFGRPRDVRDLEQHGAGEQPDKRIAHALHDRVAELGATMLCPTRPPVQRGERDPIVPQDWAEEATRLLPRGRLVVIPGGNSRRELFRGTGVCVRGAAFLNETLGQS